MQRTLVDYLTTTQSVFESLISHSDVVLRLREDGRSGGGYFCLANEVGQPLLISKVGEPDPQKLGKYLEFCQEKAARLASHAEHRLSRSSRNPALLQFGGAVRGTTHILSFSGLPELLDEILTVLTALETNELGFADAVMLATSENWNDFHRLVPEIYAFRHPKAGTHT